MRHICQTEEHLQWGVTIHIEQPTLGLRTDTATASKCCHLTTIGTIRHDRMFTFGNEQITAGVERCCACYCRAMLCIRGTSHEPVSVRVCVCLSACLSQVGVLLKRLNWGSHKQHHIIDNTGDSSFLTPKISAKFDRGHPYEGAECRWGGSKSATFDK